MSDQPLNGHTRLIFFFAFVGVCFHAAIWLLIDGIIDRLGFGRLQQLGWPFSSLYTIAALGAVTGAIWGRAVQLRQVLRHDGDEDPLDTDSESLTANISTVDWLPELPVFENRRSISHRATVPVGSASCDIFDLTTEESVGDGKTVLLTRTFVLFTVQNWPTFDLRPRRAGDQVLALAGATGITFDATSAETREGSGWVARFVDTYRLAVADVNEMMTGRVNEDDAAIRNLFKLGVMKAVLKRPDWRIQSRNDSVAFWTGAEPPGSVHRVRLLEEGRDLFLTFSESLLGRGNDEVIAAPDRAVESLRQAARIQASLLGGVLGCFAGFFTAGVVNAVQFFNQPIGKRIPQAQTMQGVAFLSAILIGTVLGALIGRLLPLQRPLLRKPKNPRRERVVGCAAGIGLFGGFFAGGVSGIILSEYLGLKFADGGLRAGLFFGGIGIGALFGPILLGVATNYLYCYITGERD